MAKSLNTILKEAASLIGNAEVVVIFAGAGMGVDSGLEQYRGENGLWTKHITINNKEINYQDLMTHSAFEEVPEKAWALIGSMIKKYNTATPHSGFNTLLEMLKGKEYFVVTSNCDEQFKKAGFEEERILECHGSVYYMQCMNIKDREIWLTPEINIDESKFEVIAPLPKCPDCGSNCRPNLFLFGDWFWVSTRSNHQQIKYNKWLKEIRSKFTNILSLEIGAGKTIGTIRNAAETFAGENYPLIRINPYDFETNHDGQLSIPLGAENGIRLIYELIKK